MWSISLNRPFGGLSARRITLFASAMLMALFATTTLLSTTIQAQVTTEDIETQATWASNGVDIDYNGWPLRRANADPTNIKEIPVLFSQTVCSNSKNVYYSASGTPENPSSEDEGKDVIVLICLDLATEITAQDKVSPLSGQIILFRGQKGSTDFDTFRPSYPVKVTVLPIEEQSADNITTCDSTHTHGLGWIICPVTNWLADTMDLLYKALSSFLIVSPLSTDRDNVMYYIWDWMRNFANVLFILGFLVIIYSQVTTVGLSNYGLKRLLPRLVIAAVLVNVSYWITAVAIDASNMLGKILYDTFQAIIESIPKEAGQTYDWKEMTWQALAGVLLSGSAGAFSAITGILGVAASAGGSLWFLLVGLAGVILAGLVAILIMAARQALIIILVIVSPLAFVAYLLPSTEKYFDRWKDLLMTMLLVYPIFSVVFGGARLAGLAIMQSADPTSPNYFNLIVLGMIVQVAPVIITPLLIKLSGSLLGRVAGLVNNPNRGIVDQTRKFAEGKSEMHKKRQIGETRDGKFVHNNPLALAARWNSNREIDRTRKLKAYETGVDAAYENSSKAHATHTQHAVNEMLKSRGENEGKAATAREIANQEALKTLDVMSRLRQQEAANAEEKNKTFYEAIQAKPSVAADALREMGSSGDTVRAFETMAEEAQSLAYAQKREANRQSSIGGALSDAYHNKILNNEEWQREAGAAEIDKFGALRIKTAAQSEMIAASAKRVENYQKRFGFENTDPNIILGKATGAIHVEDEEEQRAAIIAIGKTNDSAAVIRMSEELDLTTATESIRQEFADAVKSSGGKPIYTTSGKLGFDVPQGKDPEGNPLPTPDKLVNEWMIEATIKHKYDTAALATKASKDEVNRLFKALVTDRGIDRLTADTKVQLAKDIRRAFQDEEMYRQLGDKLKPLRSLGVELGLRGNDFEPDPTIKKT